MNNVIFSLSLLIIYFDLEKKKIYSSFILCFYISYCIIIFIHLQPSEPFYNII